MVLRIFILLFQAVIFPLMVSGFRSLFQYLASLADKIRGVKPPEKNQHKSGFVRVYRIVYRYKSDEIGVAFPENFWFWHERFDDAELVLLPHISLYTVDNQGLYFIQSDINLDLTRLHPFYYQAQFLAAEKLIFLSWEHAEILEKVVPLTLDLQKRISFVHSPGRCGSTLMSKLFESDNFISYSEPDAFLAYTNLSSMSDDDAYLKLKLITTFASKALHLLTNISESNQIEPPKQPEFLMIKFRSECASQVTITSKIFPGIKNIFMYRNAVDQVRSVYGAFSRIHMIQILLFIDKLPLSVKKLIAGNLYSILTANMRDLDAPPFNDKNYMNSVVFWPDLFVLKWLSSCHNYFTLRSSAQQIIAVSYDVLVKDYVRVYRGLLEYLELPEPTEDDMQKVAAVMAKDSQAGSVLEKKVLTRLTSKKDVCTKEIVAKIELICKMHPFIKDPYQIFPQTIGIDS